ncbi:hypothetical protein CDD83_5853 [Cordyceps sp. RAO-2017]|nr:hypothetical protein CDD83_5853 [Cordyceps sp. RAO-2017]
MFGHRNSSSRPFCVGRAADWGGCTRAAVWHGVCSICVPRRAELALGMQARSGGTAGRRTHPGQSPFPSQVLFAHGMTLQRLDSDYGDAAAKSLRAECIHGRQVGAMPVCGQDRQLSWTKRHACMHGSSAEPRLRSEMWLYLPRGARRDPSSGIGYGIRWGNGTHRPTFGRVPGRKIGDTRGRDAVHASGTARQSRQQIREQGRGSYKSGWLTEDHPPRFRESRDSN